MKSILLVKKFLGLVEMTSGLVKMIFFAPCLTYTPGHVKGPEAKRHVTGTESQCPQTQ